MQSQTHKIILYEFLDENHIPFYVGITNNYKRRKLEHLNACKKQNKYPVYNKLRKLQKQGYTLNMNIIQEHLSIEQANQLEIDTIKLYKEKGLKLYNLAEGGKGRLGYKVIFTEEWKQKLKAAKKKQYSDGQPGTMKGKKHSVEALEKIKANGVIHSENLKNKLYGNKGKTMIEICGLERAAEIRKINSETAKKTFTSSKQTQEQINKRRESYKKTYYNCIESQTKRKELNKKNRAKQLENLSKQIDIYLSGNKIASFIGNYTQLSDFLSEKHNIKIKPMSISLFINKKSSGFRFYPEVSLKVVQYIE